MRIIVTSDLHYNIARSKAPTEAIAREICGMGGDVLIFAGDTASVDLKVLDEVFDLFADFSGVKMAIAGNHELWTLGGGDSLHRYEVELAKACSRNGVHYLDGSPMNLDGVAFVGNMGWYDYTFRPSLMGIPLRFYQRKIAPGAAAYYEEHRDLVEGYGDVPSASLDITCRWMDGQRVNLPHGDLAFTQMLAAKLRDHLERVHGASDRVIVALHHLPFAELVPHTIVPALEFATAFLGSEVFGETLLDFPKVSHVFCGHSHREKSCRKGNLVCHCVGSTYREKRYEVIDV